MATKFPLRLDDDVYEYARAQALKENRSMNGFIQNIIQKYATNNGEYNFLSSFKLFRLYSAITNMENIVISGEVRTGKSVLMGIISRFHSIINSEIYNRKFDSSISPDELYNSLNQAIKDASKREKKLVILIDELSHVLFMGEDQNWYFSKLVQLIEENKDFPISFCLTTPLNIDVDIQNKLTKFFTHQIILVRGSQQIDDELSNKTFTLDEILALKSQK